MIDALGYERPRYAHLPMILGEDGSRLSKRHGAVSVLEYREQGYLPQALLNYLVRLGWSHGDREIFTRDEMIALFDLADVNASASRFDPEKLAWLNQQYIMQTPVEPLAEILRGQFERIGTDTGAGPPEEEVVEVYRERAATLAELAAACTYLYEDFDNIEPKAAKKHLRPVIKPALQKVRALLSDIEKWRDDDIQQCIQSTADELDIGFGKLGQPLRVAVTGAGISPPIDQTIRLIGRERTLARIDRAIEYINRREIDSL
jgi:glutamyl-tRNA synthetase